MMNEAAPNPQARSTRPRPYRRRMLLAIPYLWSVAAIPAIGTVQAAPGGIPLLLWWMLAGVLVTTGTLALAWRIDERRNLEAEGGVEK